MKKGKFIVLEGTDGSGKATQLELLGNFLKTHGYKVKQVDFPQYYTSFFGKLVGRFLKGEFGGINEVSPYLASLTYAGDRFEAKERIRTWLDQGKFVISNRYVGSNMAHQTVKLPKKEQLKFLRFLEKMEYKVFEIPREDVVIVLYVPVNIGQKLVNNKEKRKYLGRKLDIHEADFSHQQKASEMYLRLVKRYPYWTKIDCCDRRRKLRKPEEIHKLVCQVLKKKKII
jgi:dTMP kinase